MTKLYLIRHGETDWNLEGRWQGQADVPLNANGEIQAQQIAASLVDNPLAAIISSDLLRARQTARAIADLKRLPVHLDRRLREIHQGRWQGLLVSEIQARYAREFEQRHADPLRIAPPGGETAYQVRQRALEAIRDILDQYPHAEVALVSHGFTLAIIRTHFLELPFEQVWDLVPPNASVNTLVIEKFTQSN
jgi:probable phosphoglycerate mutase